MDRKPLDLLAKETLELVSEYTDVPIYEICGPNRSDDIVVARSLFASFMRKWGYTYHSIGKYINRDHSTVVALCRSHVNRMETRLVYRLTAQSIKEDTIKLKKKYANE